MLYIIIGLPASGKTTYYHQFLNQMKFHDDFISSFFDNELIHDLENGDDICITDPRLCDIKRFRDYMQIFREYVEIDKIKLILFKNDYEQCLINANNRKKKNVNNMIKIYTKLYNTDLYINEGYSYEIIDVAHNY